MLNAEKIFVNSAWAKKIPAKSPQGTELEPGVNAFASIDDALETYPNLGEKQVILLDKSATVYNTDGDTDINFTAIASQEIDKDGSVKGDTATSKVTAAGNLSLIYNADAGAGDVAVEGFANVNISTTVAEPESTPFATVLGGKNTVTHTFSGDEEKYKESATISSTANGELVVSNSKIDGAAGAYAVVDDDVSIDPDVAILSVAGVGDSDEDDFAYGESSLYYLAGYSKATLKNGSFAGQLVGGSLNYSASRDVTYEDDSNEVKKSFSANNKTAGTLTVSDSILDTASGYSTAEIKDESQFNNIYGYTETVSEKSYYFRNEIEKFDTDLNIVKSTRDTSRSRSAAGKATITNLGEQDEDSRNVIGYSTVTVSTSDVGTLTAGGYTEKTSAASNSEEKKANANAHVIQNAGFSYSASRTYSQSGTLDAQNGNTGLIAGFSKVTLKEVASVDGQILASNDSFYNNFGADGFAGKSEYANAHVFENDLDANEMLSDKSTHSTSESAAAGGSLTISQGSVAGNVAGFATVTALQVTIDGGVAAGKFAYSLSSSTIEKAADESEETKESSSLSSSAAGTLTVTKESLIDGDVTGFATVTLSDISVDGNIYGGNTTEATSATHSESNKNGFISSTSQKDSGKWTGTGKLSMEDVFVAGTIRGYSTVEVEDSDIGGGIINVGSYTINSSSDHSEDTAKSNEQAKDVYSYSMVSGGTVTLDDAGVGITEVDVQGLYAEGSIFGFATVTATETSFEGSIIGGKKDSSATETYSAAPDKNYDLVENTAWTEKFTESATGKFTMTESQFTGSDAGISGFQTVSLTSVNGEINNGISAGNTNDSVEEKLTVIAGDTVSKTFKQTNTESATGSLTISAGNGQDAPELIVGQISGFSKITADYGIIDGIDDGATHKETYSLTFSKTEKKDATISSTKASASMSNSAAGSVSLSGIATNVEGDINGYASITLNGANVDGNINGNSDTSSISLATEADEDGYLSSSYSYNDKKNPTLTLNLSNDAAIQGEMMSTGIKTAVINRADAGDMYSFAVTTQEARTLKFVDDDEYTGAVTYSYSKTAAGTYTLTNADVGSIRGAVKVTATNSELGFLNSRNVSDAGNYLVTGPDYTTTPVEFPLDEPEYAVVSPETAIKLVGTETETRSAKATATLEKSIVDGGIYGFATLKLTKSEVWGDIASGAGKSEMVINYDKEKLNQTIIETSDVAGTLTASSILVDGSISGFNTVTLDKSTVGGSVTGGKTVATTIVKGEGATYAEAGDDAWEDPVEPETTITAAGTFKTTGLTTIQGEVASFKTATFNGDTTVMGGIYGISGEKDTVTIAAKSGLTLQGTAVLGMNEEESAYTIDTVNISGVLRIAVADAEDFTFSVNKFSGNGTIAVQADAFADVRDALRPYVGNQFEFINGGDEFAVTAVRSSKEELADNQQSKATAMKVDDATHGWLSAQEDQAAGLFADTEDWYSFAKAKAGAPYEVNVTLDDADRIDDLQASLWSGKEEIIGGIVWEDTGFYIEDAVLSQYSSVQLKLTVGEEVDPLSYRITVASIA